MPEVHAIKVVHVENTQFSMVPYSFRQENGRFQPVPLTIESGISPIFLTNVWYTSILNRAFISVDSILSPEHVLQLIALTSIQNRGAFRLVVVQLNMADVDWGLINLEHFCLVKASEAIVHLSVPIEKAAEKVHTALEMVTIEKLCRQINWEGFILYSSWLDAEMIALSAHISKVAAEEFQLQAKLDDFHHEVNGALISGFRKTCRESVIASGNPSLTTDERHRNEREIITLRMEIRNSLLTQCEVAREIVKGILKIESKFPEFTSLKLALTLFCSLIEPQLNYQGEPGQGWEQQLVLISLLHQQLDVPWCLSGDKERMGKAQMIPLVIGGMVEKYGMEPLISMAMQWDMHSELFKIYQSLRTCSKSSIG